LIESVANRTMNFSSLKGFMKNVTGPMAIAITAKATAT
jgi:hypothetical protein